jgi:hypothetical protein
MDARGQAYSWRGTQPGTYLGPRATHLVLCLHPFICEDDCVMSSSTDHALPYVSMGRTPQPPPQILPERGVGAVTAVALSAEVLASAKPGDSRGAARRLLVLSMVHVFALRGIQVTTGVPLNRYRFTKCYADKRWSHHDSVQYVPTCHHARSSRCAARSVLAETLLQCH